MSVKVPPRSIQTCHMSICSSLKLNQIGQTFHKQKNYKYLLFLIKNNQRKCSFMRLRNLETFCWAATTDNFCETAERLVTTQPAILARIEAFESNLGAALFKRRGRLVSLI
ncbi:MAG: LysR family transcriptional regulator, partial [Pseudomonadota bacterium]|nr:LysR family transcriptional regulator [Pseudomonadota bacterium]